MLFLELKIMDYMVGTVYNYVCPICNLSRKLSEYNLKDSPFNSSNIIDFDEMLNINEAGKVLIK